MKRIVVLIDGTWNKEGSAGNTNVATLDIAHWIAANTFIKGRGGRRYRAARALSRRRGHRGRFLQKNLGGAIGLGLKQIIRECYGFVVADFAPGDEIYIVGFSEELCGARFGRTDRCVGHSAPGGRRYVRSCVATLPRQADSAPASGNGEYGGPQVHRRL